MGGHRPSQGRAAGLGAAAASHAPAPAANGSVSDGLPAAQGALWLDPQSDYIGEAVVWLGWALFYGSPAVWAGLGILCAAFAKVVRWEERRLLERFGDDYRAYLATVPRWLGRGRGISYTDAARRNAPPKNYGRRVWPTSIR